MLSTTKRRSVIEQFEPHEEITELVIPILARIRPARWNLLLISLSTSGDRSFGLRRSWVCRVFAVRMPRSVLEAGAQSRAVRQLRCL